jgi:hypothetical protein
VTNVGQLYERIDDGLAGWIGRQRLYFVGTAPLDADGHVNISPKGSMDTFRILGPTTVAYLDLMGSGIETAAHLRENGRIVVMFCAFEGPPKIVRLHGTGEVVEPSDPRFDGLLAHFDPDDDLRAVMRAIVQIEVTRISDSCGFVVPRMDYVGERDQLFRWGEAKQRKDGDSWKRAYQQANHRTSIDGLPALDLPDVEDAALVARQSSRGRVL